MLHNLSSDCLLSFIFSALNQAFWASCMGRYMWILKASLLHLGLEWVMVRGNCLFQVVIRRRLRGTAYEHLFWWYEKAIPYPAFLQTPEHLKTHPQSAHWEQSAPLLLIYKCSIYKGRSWITMQDQFSSVGWRRVLNYAQSLGTGNIRQDTDHNMKPFAISSSTETTMNHEYTSNSHESWINKDLLSHSRSMR